MILLSGFYTAFIRFLYRYWHTSRRGRSIGSCINFYIRFLLCFLFVCLCACVCVLVCLLVCLFVCLFEDYLLGLTYYRLFYNNIIWGSCQVPHDSFDRSPAKRQLVGSSATLRAPSPRAPRVRGTPCFIGYHLSDRRASGCSAVHPFLVFTHISNSFFCFFAKITIFRLKT